ncbi:MAG: ROK family protein [Ruminococcaceae bacterium]|nr:ROK family protein [Oscillospiraceae bacterium]
MILGFDIGGTKCAVITALQNNDEFSICQKQTIPTNLSIAPEEMIEQLIKIADEMIKGESISAIGISCGGPLDSKNGIVLGPPNLPGWDHVEICKILKAHYGVKVNLQNDANACAVAEWKFGAGKGFNNVIFLTFGTGLGAGLVLDGRLYSGTNDNAGECGHIRLDAFGPVGFGKAGSFEGFCSGNGIAQLGFTLALEQVQSGKTPLYFEKGMSNSDVTAKSVAIAAEKGDETALRVYEICGEQLGKGLSVLIDILNPERIVIGSVFARSEELLRPAMERVINSEALAQSAKCCKIVPAKLGEKIGDYAAIATALL